jgi:hypothetical protein
LGGFVASTTLAHATSAPSGRYVISGAAGRETVTDTKTKLTWERSFELLSTHDDAKARCVSLDATLGGTGWRLPTYKELLTLVSYVGTVPFSSVPFIDLDAFPNTPLAAFWSSTLDLSGSASVWHLVNFEIGQEGGADQLARAASRCVR